MKRHQLNPRTDWQCKAEEIGFTYHTCGTPSQDGEGTYWDESICYEFSIGEIDEVEDATKECHELCLKAVDRVVNDPVLLSKLCIPSEFHYAIRKSWENQDPSLYGRFDFAYDGKGTPPKMLEYNADTPTMVIETALMQWFWLQDVKPGKDQFNSLHEKLIDRFREIQHRFFPGSNFYFAGCSDSLEEYQTCIYFQDLATQAGIRAEFIDLSEIGWNGVNFTDLKENPIKYWFKLYPWEWMFTDDFGVNVTRADTGIIEPIWKSVLSNKGILPILHEMFPDHPNILPATFDPKHLPVDEWDWLRFQEQGSAEELDLFSQGKLNPTSYVAKPMLSREGANIDFMEMGRTVVKTEGRYTGPRIYQKKAELFQYNGHRAVIGSWIVGNEPAGMIIRDHDKEIVLDTSKVVPHFIN